MTEDGSDEARETDAVSPVLCTLELALRLCNSDPDPTVPFSYYQATLPIVTQPLNCSTLSLSPITEPLSATLLSTALRSAMHQRCTHYILTSMHTLLVPTFLLPALYEPML